MNDYRPTEMKKEILKLRAEVENVTKAYREFRERHASMYDEDQKKIKDLECQLDELGVAFYHFTRVVDLEIFEDSDVDTARKVVAPYQKKWIQKTSKGSI